MGRAAWVGRRAHRHRRLGRARRIPRRTDLRSDGVTRPAAFGQRRRPGHAGTVQPARGVLGPAGVGPVHRPAVQRRPQTGVRHGAQSAHRRLPDPPRSPTVSSGRGAHRRLRRGVAARAAPTAGSGNGTRRTGRGRTRTCHGPAKSGRHPSRSGTANYAPWYRPNRERSIEIVKIDNEWPSATIYDWNKEDINKIDKEMCK